MDLINMSIPANGHDICNYVVRYGFASCQLQAILKLDGRLDFDKLSKAVRQSVDAEPVFGCRFVEAEKPYWKRLDDVDSIRFCEFEAAGKKDEAVRRFLESPSDMDRDPMVKVRLIRSAEAEVLGIRVNHACCDGAGIKEYIQLLSGIYSSLEEGNGEFIPHPRIGGRKDQDRLFDALGIRIYSEDRNPRKKTKKTGWAFPWRMGYTGEVRYVLRRLPGEQLDVMKDYGKSRGATMNDLILTAFYRAMFDFSKPPYGIPMDISSTIDLRRYLPDGKTQAIRNFSGGFHTKIPREKGESFEGTLKRVAEETKKIKNEYPGLRNAIAGEIAEKADFPRFLAHFKRKSQATGLLLQVSRFRSRVCYPGLTNVGLLSKSSIHFGKRMVTDAYLIPPAIRAPSFSIAVSTYNGVISLAMSYYKDSVSRKDIRRLLDKMKDELMEGCR